jgi:hypothetical protein
MPPADLAIKGYVDRKSKTRRRLAMTLSILDPIGIAATIEFGELPYVTMVSSHRNIIAVPIVS